MGRNKREYFGLWFRRERWRKNREIANFDRSHKFSNIVLNFKFL